MTAIACGLLLALPLVGLTYLATSRGAAATLFRRGLRTLAMFLLVIGLAAMSVLAVRQALQEIGPSWRAALGQGMPGTFTADDTYHIGRGRERVWRGTFVSDDLSVTRSGVQLSGVPAEMALGVKVQVLDSGAHRVVYVPGPGGVLGRAVVLLILVVFWSGAGLTVGMRARRWLSHRRRQRHLIEHRMVGGGEHAVRVALAPKKRLSRAARRRVASR
ncbi:hypothetical protein ACFQZ4_46120 [Catellatospora coxensis]|uniref:hypothetical protein n=1 Tax=Catellatospora coxensis TaxID=310354 RepID=UPI0019411278|nr:hypothetical protein [Catellatospora coxensis]